MPCDGSVTKVNEILEESPQNISINAEQEGWLMEFEITDASQIDDLLDEKSYLAYLETIEEDH